MNAVLRPIPLKQESVNDLDNLAPNVDQNAVDLLDAASATPCERPAPVAPKAPAAPTPAATAPARVKTSREARAERRKARTEARSVAKNRLETPPVLLVH